MMKKRFVVFNVCIDIVHSEIINISYLEQLKSNNHAFPLQISVSSYEDEESEYSDEEEPLPVSFVYC